MHNNEPKVSPPTLPATLSISKCSFPDLGSVTGIEGFSRTSKGVDMLFQKFKKNQQPETRKTSNVHKIQVNTCIKAYGRRRAVSKNPSSVFERWNTFARSALTYQNKQLKNYSVELPDSLWQQTISYFPLCFTSLLTLKSGSTRL